MMPPTADDVRLQLDRILAAAPFANAERLSRFLRYVVERTLVGEGDRLKEYVIGTEVFDRGDGYDPRVDSIVRVEAGRLRTKVEEYYHTVGSSDPVIIRIPKGSYTPVFEQRITPIAAPAERKGTEGTIEKWRLPLGVLAGAMLLVAIAAWRTGLWTTLDKTHTTTIAVLPFSQYSTNQADQLLADRLADGVTSELAGIGTLGVVSRTSALQFAGTRRSLKEIARTLNADLILEGSLAKEGERLRVSARLVDGTRDQKFWVENFTGNVADLPDLQRRIAAAAAAAATTRGRR